MLWLLCAFTALAQWSKNPHFDISAWEAPLAPYNYDQCTVLSAEIIVATGTSHRISLHCDDDDTKACVHLFEEPDGHKQVVMQTKNVDCAMHEVKLQQDIMRQFGAHAP